jgi:hypothetical protein
MAPEFRVLLRGGLGNQLFQYAFGRALAERYQATLRIDIGSGFARDFVYRRKYELDVFELWDGLELIQPTKLEMQVQRVKLAFAQRKWAFADSYLIEPSGGVYCDLATRLKAGRSYTCFGYWQSQRYFSEIEALLRQELHLTRKLSAKNQVMGDRMQAQESVAVHVRRVQYDCAIDPEYYDRAITAMIERVPDATFYCFSDDLDWCRAHLLPKYPMVLVDNRNLHAIEDFQMMTHCRHYIIANSSFSWWAAWLGGSEGVVLTPQADMSHRQPAEGDRPSHWRCL